MLYKDIPRIAWPTMIERTVAAVIAMVDMMMVGNLGPWLRSGRPRVYTQTGYYDNGSTSGSTALIARSRALITARKPTLFAAFILGIVGSIIIVPQVSASRRLSVSWALRKNQP